MTGFNNRAEKLRETGITDYTNVIYLFLTQNEKKLYHQNIHSNKLSKLGLEIYKKSCKPDKIIFNYPSHNLSKRKKKKNYFGMV